MPRRTKTGANIVDANDKKPIRIHGLAGTDHIVPPAYAFGIVIVIAGNVMRGIERMTHQDRVAALFIQGAVRLDGQLVAGQHLPAAQVQRFIKRNEFGLYRAHRTFGDQSAGWARGANVGAGDGISGHLDLFSWIYGAPASGSGKSAQNV
jgi:hypothetical protein